MNKQRTLPVLRGALFFGAIGPLVGGVLMSIFMGFQGHQAANIQHWNLVLISAAFFILPSYLFGLLPALLTGLLACAFLDRIRSFAGFLGVCLLAEIVVSGVFGVAVNRWMIAADHGGISPDIPSDDWTIALFFSLLGAIPALVAGALWWRRQRRAGGKGNMETSTV